MQEFSYVVTDQEGLHARPAGLLVKAASAFQSNILVSKDNKAVNAKRLFAVMGLSVKCADEIKISCEGPDEAEAAESLEKLLKENL
jgi:phosphocarrier protein HPr